MRKEVREAIGKMAISLGSRAVGKSVMWGMYDPKIPEEVKKEKRRDDSKR